MRRPSLVEELHGKDHHYASTRIHNVLQTLSPVDRHVVMKDFEQSAPAQQAPTEQAFFLARLLDALFDRKTHQQQQLQQQQYHHQQVRPARDSHDDIPFLMNRFPLDVYLFPDRD